MAAFLKHVKRVLSHLKRPAIRPVSSTVASSPSKYHEHIARKRLKADQVRRQSAPPPQLSQMPPSPYQDLRGKIRQARKSSPVRRPPPTAAIFASPRKQGQLATSLRESRHDDDDDSDEEVENVLLTRSSAPLVSEQEDGPAIEEGQNQEIEFVQEEKGDNENESMVVEEEEEEITTETQVVETQVVGTQIVQKNLLDRSALGVFLETQAESQVDAQMEDSQEADIPPQENGDTPQMGEGSQDVGFWDNGMASAGGREAPMDADMDGYADLAQYADAAPSEQQHQQQEQEEEDSQASQALPGRSDAPSPSLANPQSFDDSLYDELAQDADVTFESANQFIGEEVDISQVPTPRAVVSATAESSREAGESSLGNVEEEDNVAASHVGANDTAENSLLETMAPPVESTPQAPPRRRGRPPKKKPKYVCTGPLA